MRHLLYSTHIFKNEAWSVCFDFCKKPMVMNNNSLISTSFFASCAWNGMENCFSSVFLCWLFYFFANGKYFSHNTNEAIVDLIIFPLSLIDFLVKIFWKLIFCLILWWKYPREVHWIFYNLPFADRLWSSKNNAVLWSNGEWNIFTQVLS